MRFTKMHGLGNDYIYVFGRVPQCAAELSIRLSDRHFGVGSDGMIWISPSQIADFEMRIFNADGSEAKMCGNGIRCVGKYLYEKGYTRRTHLRIETLAGVRALDLITDAGRVKRVTVDMGGVACGRPMELDVGAQRLVCNPVSVGNPHAVFFVDNAEAVPLNAWGPQIEGNKAFPDGVNAEFAQILDPHTLRMRVWERGSGVTMACGTGACASVAAAIARGIFSRNDDIRVILDGGALTVRMSEEGHAIMSGPAETVYEGEIQIC